MQRSFLTLFGIILTAVVLCGAGYGLTRYFSAGHFARSTDDLDWLRKEFRLSDTQLGHIRQLHQAYRPQCEELCAQIAGRQSELREAVRQETNSAAVSQKLMEIAALRAQCQAAMLRHFKEVSQAMPPPQGRRYLAEMQRLTLGAHEQIEHRMSPSAPATHGHR